MCVGGCSINERQSERRVEIERAAEWKCKVMGIDARNREREQERDLCDSNIGSSKGKRCRA